MDGREVAPPCLDLNFIQRATLFQLSVGLMVNVAIRIQKMRAEQNLVNHVSHKTPCISLTKSENWSSPRGRLPYSTRSERWAPENVINGAPEG